MDSGIFRRFWRFGSDRDRGFPWPSIGVSTWEDHWTGLVGAVNLRPMPTLQRPSAQLHYQKRGRGPAVLMLQGCGVVGEGWRPQIEGLSDRFTCIAVDNRGIGASVIDRPGKARLSIEQMAADALAVMDAEGIDRFHIVAHSMGGLLAQEIALGAHARVLSLSLLCTFAHGKQGARVTPAIMWTGMRMMIGTRAMRRNAFMELVMPESVLRSRDRAQLAEELRPLFGRDLADQPPIVMKQVSAMGRYDAFDRLGQLQGIATLVLSAGHDRISLPAYGRELAAAIPGARLVEIAEAGHGVAIQCAALVNAELAEHIDAAEAAAAAATA
jgi:aminoacrylate hydrolase